MAAKSGTWKNSPPLGIPGNAAEQTIRVASVMTYCLTGFQVDANEVGGGKHPEVCDVCFVLVV